MGWSERRPVTLALDAEGGDHAPEEIVAGALAVSSPELRVLLAGRPEVLESLVPAGSAHIEILPSEGAISAEEESARAVRGRPMSSIVVGARAVAEGRAQGFVGAGSTGAMLAAGLLVVKRVPGVKRPAIVTVLPGADGPVVLLDAGANADCRPEHLLEFGVLGSVFARLALGIGSPRVGLLNIGEEQTKGNSLALGAYPLLASSDLHFVGNVEGRDLLFGAADVVVTDGFTGNVALKSSEALASALMTMLEEELMSTATSRIGAFLSRGAYRRMLRRTDPHEYGGAPLLGIRGCCVIGHGRSNERAIRQGIRVAGEYFTSGVNEKIESAVESLLADAPSTETA
jgi:glycerol-3-phosphate acyltransferase PlsX